MYGDVAGDVTSGTMQRACSHSAFRVCQHRGARRVECVETLRAESRDYAGQHVAAAGRGECGHGVRCDCDFSIRRGDHSAGALEDDHGTVFAGERARRANPIARNVRSARAKQSCGFTGVRREDIVL